MNATWKYLYAIGPADEASGLDLVDFVEAGLNGTSVDVVTSGQLAAYVSDVPAKKVRPVRKHLAAHHAVLRNLALQTTALPMSFGMIAEDESEVVDLLESRHDDLAERVVRLAGRIEMTLRVRWDVENVFQMFVETSEDLRAARDAIVAAGPADRDEKIAAGELFAKLLEQARDTDKASLADDLLGGCEEVRWNDPRDETESVSLAALVHRDAIDDFEAAVHRAAEAFDDRYVFDLGGPHPPHSFVSVQLSLDAA
ncbi:MAG: GvpL/GvpF family gas vesicle protein [Planctomycetota bacterium]